MGRHAVSSQRCLLIAAVVHKRLLVFYKRNCCANSAVGCAALMSKCSMQNSSLQGSFVHQVRLY